MGRIRGFVAIPVKGLLEIEELAREIGTIRGIKGVRAENIHLTLKFLGGVDEEEEIPEIIRSLEEVAQRHHAFSISFQGTGAFPNLQRMRVAWIGIKGEELGKLAKDVLRALPIKEGERPQKFGPHLTIGRVKFREGIKKAQRVLERYRYKDFGTLKVRGIELMQSTLTPGGPIYSVIRHFPLAEG
ncbi:MAG: RNA 2',3'-cyclic phosphodiesterase [Thermoplasmata archaeon]|nr:RNA 2',3'-cyclic phosphodiesterase [Thermoplasmata archaeon]